MLDFGLENKIEIHGLGLDLQVLGHHYITNCNEIQRPNKLLNNQVRDFFQDSMGKTVAFTVAYVVAALGKNICKLCNKLLHVMPQ